MPRFDFYKVFQFSLLTVVCCSVLWKGGKALDAVWALSLLSVFSCFLFLSKQSLRDVHVQRIPWHLFSLVLLFIFFTCISFAFSLTQNYGLDEVFQTVALGIIFLLILSLESVERFQSRFARTLSLALLFALLIGFAVYVFQPLSRFVGSFFDYRFHTDYWPNAWGEFFLLAWPALFWSLFLRRTVTRRTYVVSALIFGTALGGFFLSYSRGSFIAFALQLALLTILVSVQWFRVFPLRKIISLATLSLIVSALIFVGFNHLRIKRFPVESVLKKATFQSSEGTSSISERQLFFEQSITLLHRRPLIGYGPYAFRFVQPHIQTGVLETSDHPHNVFLKFALERGVMTSLMFLLILCFSFLPALWSVLRSRKDASLLLTTVFLVSVFGVIAHNLIDYNFQFVGIALPFWMMLAVLSKSKSFTPAPLPMLQRFVLLILATTFLLCVLVEGSFLGLSSLARHREARGDFSGALSFYELTDHSFFSRDAWLARSAILLQQKKYQDAMNAVTSYIRLNSSDARGWRLLGDISLAWNKREEALQAYDKAYAYGRWNDPGITRGLLYLLSLRSTSLRSRRLEFEVLLHAYSDAILNNAHFIALSPAVEETLSLAELLSRIFPEHRSDYNSLMQRVQDHALLERSRYTSRPHGILW